MYQQLFDLLFYKADNEYGGRLPFPVRFLLDEFANIGRIPNFEIFIATMRSREVSVDVVLQNVAQLKSVYKDHWETITGNCDTLLFLGDKEQSTLEYISKMIGKTTLDNRNINESRGQNGSYSLNYQILGRDLITPDEVGLLGGTECIDRNSLIKSGGSAIIPCRHMGCKRDLFSYTEPSYPYMGAKQKDLVQIRGSKRFNNRGRQDFVLYNLH